MNNLRYNLNNIKKKFILGTAQLGKPYGINNLKKKRIDKSEIDLIIKTLLKNGVNHLDNAENYNFNLNYIKNYQVTIDTKILINKHNSKKENLIKLIQKYINKKIKLDTIYIHNPQNIFSSNGESIYKKLIELKKKKKFKKIGISIYDLYLLKKIVKNFKIDVVQLPYNLLDRRFEKYFKILKKKRILINIRSVFLQGALIPKSKNKISQSHEIQEFIKTIRKKKLSKIHVCLGFIAKNKLINKIIIGVDNHHQLKEVLNIKFEKKHLYSKNFSSSNLNIIDPRYWKNI